MFKSFLKNKIKAFINIINDLIMICASYFYRYKAINKGLIGIEFDNFGRNLGWNLIKNHHYSLGKTLVIHPVNIVRYFEFQFVYESNDWHKCSNVLDVSSPRIFGLYISHNYKNLNYNYINPDSKDTTETQKLLIKPEHWNNLYLSNKDATRLDYQDNSFDTIVSISVIEHIPNNGDIEALKEMWRVLSPGGNLIITVPYLPNYFEEYFDFDEYQLYPATNDGKYFGSRYYDTKVIRERIFNTIGKEPDKITIFGEVEKGTFFNYREREWKKGILESLKDSYYIANEYTLFNSLDDIIGLAVVGVVFQK